jgi:hypothetical protein
MILFSGSDETFKVASAGLDFTIASVGLGLETYKYINISRHLHLFYLDFLELGLRSLVIKKHVRALLFQDLLKTDLVNIRVIHAVPNPIRIFDKAVVVTTKAGRACMYEHRVKIVHNLALLFEPATERVQFMSQ